MHYVDYVSYDYSSLLITVCCICEFFSQYSSTLNKLVLSIETVDLGTTTNDISHNAMIMMTLDGDIIIRVRVDSH